MAVEVHSNVLKKLDNTKQAIYTCPDVKSVVIHSLNCSNISNNVITPTFSILDYSTNEEYILGNLIRIPPKVTLAWDKPINLKTGDTIYAKSHSDYESGETAHLYLAIFEVYENPFERYANAFAKFEDEEFKNIYECPSDRINSIIHGMQFANVNINNGFQNSFITVRIIDIDNLNTPYIIGQNIRVPPNTIFVWDKTVNLLSGQKLSIKSTVPNNLHCVASMLEIDKLSF